MFRTVLACSAILGLAACGGGSSYSSNNARSGATYQASGGYPSGATLAFARGPIQKACQASDRKARSRSRCGCIQAVADQTLSSAAQRRGAKFFKDPHKAQEMRQSDNSNNESFWLEWKAYGQSAALQCSGS